MLQIGEELIMINPYSRWILDSDGIVIQYETYLNISKNHVIGIGNCDSCSHEAGAFLGSDERLVWANLKTTCEIKFTLNIYCPRCIILRRLATKSNVKQNKEL